MIGTTTNEIARQLAELDALDIRPLLRDEFAESVGRRSVSLDIQGDPTRCTLRIDGTLLTFEMRGSLHITDRLATEAREALITGRITQGRGVVLDAIARAA